MRGKKKTRTKEKTRQAEFRGESCFIFVSETCLFSPLDYLRVNETVRSAVLISILYMFLTEWLKKNGGSINDFYADFNKYNNANGPAKSFFFYLV